MLLSMARALPSPRIGLPALWGALLLAASGCILGGQSTDDDATCDQERRPLPDDASPSPQLGLAPSAVTAWALGSSSELARWQPPPDGITTNTPPGEVPLEFTLSRDEGNAIEIGGCDPRIEVPLLLSLATDDGRLAESVSATLQVRRLGFAVVEAQLDFRTLGGSFAWEPEPSSQVELVQPTFTIALTPHGSAGSFDSFLQLASAGAVSNLPGGEGLLVWPSDSLCPLRSVPRDLTTDESSWQTALAYGQSETWSGSTEAQPAGYQLSLITASEACDFEDGPATIGAVLELSNQEENWVLSIPGSFSDQNGRLEFSIAPDARLGGSPSDFVSRLGDFGVNVEGYEHLAIEMPLWLTETEGSGRFLVVGYRDDCEATCDGAGCGGCGPLTRMVLLEVTFAR